MKTAYRAAELADFLELELRGCPDTPISGLATLEDAGASDISFVANPRYLALLKDSGAGAVILSAEHADRFPRVCLVSQVIEREEVFTVSDWGEWIRPCKGRVACVATIILSRLQLHINCKQRFGKIGGAIIV